MTKTKELAPVYWNLASIWNEVAFKENKELKARDYVYASEIGMPFYDRFLKMKGVAYTNPPNNRSLRKFLAGNIWEYTVKQILVAAGVYRHEEIKVDATPYKGLLDVHGRLDFIAGGYVDADKAFANLEALNLPDYLFVVGKKIIEALEGQNLQEKILELKAVSTFAMDKVEKMRMPMPNHTLQAFHYEKNGKMNADVAYICKDDCRMAQFSINAAVSEPIYKEDLEKITHYYKKNKKPPLDPLAKFDTTLGKFSKNLGVEYSPYLSHYGFAQPDDYREAIGYIDKWNRALNRFVLAETGKTTPTGKPITITAKNNEMKAEIERSGYKFQDLIACKISLGAIEDEETE